MADRSATSEAWLYGAAYAALALVVMLIHLVPLAVGPGRIPGPDLLVALTFAWLLRRPHIVPTPLIAAVFLLADILLMRPIGLHAVLMVLAVEFLRTREAQTREQTLLAEWLMIGILVIVLSLLERITLAIFAVDQASFGLTLFEALATILAYPLVVFATRYVFGLTKMSASEADAKGRT